MKIVFLDCDGVLCLSRSVSYNFEETDPTLIHDACDGNLPLELRAVQLLKHITDSVSEPCGVVLTTTWRLDERMRRFLHRALTGAGIEVIGDTPDLGASGRGGEIKAWLLDSRRQKEQVTGFVILDDEHRGSFEEQGLQDHFVQTVLRDPEDPSKEGITQDKAEEAIAVLARKSVVSIDYHTPHPESKPENSKLSVTTSEETAGEEGDAVDAAKPTLGHLSEDAISSLMYMPVEFPKDGDAHEIIPNLWLGNSDAAVAAVDRGYQAVLNCSIDAQQQPLWAQVRGAYSESGIQCLELPMDDSSGADISAHLPAGADFIHTALEAGKKCLVHCSCGKSRSTCEVLAYLMKYKTLGFYESFSLTRAKRLLAYPKWHLLTQVLDYELTLRGSHSVPVELLKQYHSEFREGTQAYKLETLQSLTTKGEAYCLALLDRAGGDVEEAGMLYFQEESA